MVVSKPAIRYLRVMIDGKLSFKEHLGYVSQEASSGKYR